MRKTICLLLVVFLCVTIITSSAWAVDTLPSKLDAPKLIALNLLNDDGVPYIEVVFDVPDSIIDLIETRPADGDVLYEYAIQIDSNPWGEFGNGGYLDTVLETEEAKVNGFSNRYKVTIEVLDEGNLETIDIKEHTYSFMFHFYYDHFEGVDTIGYIFSPSSNALSIGTPSFYSKASSWAESELQKALELGLIPDLLKDQDLTAPITREEFCELAILLYEKTSGMSGIPYAPNPFTDTKNQQILKAYQLGITSGTSTTTFSPSRVINREQCAVMLFNAIKAIVPNADFSITGVKDFPDQNEISSWAINAAKYMSKIGIINGNSQGMFMPKASSTVQEAAKYGMATREQAIVMSVKIYEKFK